MLLWVVVVRRRTKLSWAVGAATVVIAGRKKGKGDQVAAVVLGEGHPVRIQDGVERQQGWPRRPQGGHRQPWKLHLASGSHGRQPWATGGWSRIAGHLIWLYYVDGAGCWNWDDYGWVTASEGDRESSSPCRKVLRICHWGKLDCWIGEWWCLQVYRMWSFVLYGQPCWRWMQMQ